MASAVPFSVDLLIVGAGPAGFSAAIYGKQAGLEPLVVSSSDASLIATTDRVNNYLGLGDIGGMEIWKSMEDHFRAVCGQDASMNFEVKTLEVAEDGSIIARDGRGGEIRSRAVIWAAGAKPKKLGLPGEEDIEAVSYCATCDGSFYSGDPHLTVIGGGDSAAEEALYLAEIVDEVTVLVRNDLSSKAELTERLEAHPKVKIRRGVRVEEALEIEGMQLDLALDSGQSLRTSGLFVAIGHIPNSFPLQGHAELNETGFAISSKVPGLFLAGDVRGENYRQAIIAAGDGARAGIEAADYIRSL